MPIGEGWFIDRQTGEIIPIQEHATAVRAEPERYRVGRDKIERLSRADLLTLVFKRGFIRVRWDKSGVVFEFHGNHEQALRQIRDFLNAQGVGPCTVVRINDLSGEMEAIRGCWKDLEQRLAGCQVTDA